MILVRTLAAVGLLVSLGAAAFAQTDSHPEYAGTWNLNYGKGNYKPPKRPPEAVVITLTDSTIEFSFTKDGKTYKEVTYTVDGKEHLLHEKTPHDRTYYSAEWKGGKDDVLAIHVRIATQETSEEPMFDAYTGYSYRAEETWNLSPNRRVLVFRSVAKGLNNSMKVYDKQ
jgi:hypothetical protein